MIRIDYASLHVKDVGTFSIDEYMGITFKDDEPDGYGLDMYWRSHGSNLNENGYPVIWESWKKFCEENSFNPHQITYPVFVNLMKRLFNAYDNIK